MQANELLGHVFELKIGTSRMANGNKAHKKNHPAKPKDQGHTAPKSDLNRSSAAPPQIFGYNKQFLLCIHWRKMDPSAERKARSHTHIRIISRSINSKRRQLAPVIRICCSAHNGDMMTRVYSVRCTHLPTSKTLRLIK